MKQTYYFKLYVIETIILPNSLLELTLIALCNYTPYWYFFISNCNTYKL